MKGSVQRHNKNSWRLYVDLGKDDKGKRKRKTEVIQGSKSDAQKRLRELLTERDKGTLLSNSRVTVKELVEMWLRDYGEVHVSPRTLEGYKTHIRCYILPNLGHIRIDQLSPQHVQSLYTKMHNQGLSAATIRHAHKRLSQVLKYAIKWELIARNVCEVVTLPRSEYKEIRFLDADEVSRLIEASSNSPIGKVIYLAVYTGMRRSELMGLRWSDVDIAKRTISINQTLQRIKGQGLVPSEPKTSYSRRCISISPNTAGFLKSLKASQIEQLESIDIAWDESRYVFSRIDGEPIHPDNVTKGFLKIVKRINITGVRFHDLRHAHATLMLKAGVHPKIVSERLGHSSVNITLDIYSHVLPGMQEAAVQAFDEAMMSKSTNSENEVNVTQMSHAGGF